MPETRDVVIIGGGHNGLVTAFTSRRRALNPWYSNVERKLVAQPSPRNFIPDFAAPSCRTTLGRCVRMSSATCSLKNMG